MILASLIESKIVFQELCGRFDFQTSVGGLAFEGEIEFAAGLIPPCHTKSCLKSTLLGAGCVRAVSHVLLSSQELCERNNLCP